VLVKPVFTKVVWISHSNYWQTWHWTLWHPVALKEKGVSLRVISMSCTTYFRQLQAH